MIRLSRSRVAGGSILLAALFLYGCGGGGGPTGVVTGVVTDVDGKAVAGARVSSGGSATTSLSNGTFTLSGVHSGYRTLYAEIFISGHKWNGQTVVDVIDREQNRSVNIVVSDEQNQGGITGRVIGPTGDGLAGAKVFVVGPWGSTLAITDNNGYYEVDRLTAGVRYIVTASLAGFVNQSQQDQLVIAGQFKTISFALALGSSQVTLPAPKNASAQAWTIASDVTRADDRTRSVYEWLKRLYRRKKGLPDGPQARFIERKNAGRSTPSGSVIEVDLFWSYKTSDENFSTDLLFGYAIKRGTSQNALDVTAVLRDPLASVFFDVDPFLTPDVVYYYTIHRLDTVGFPANGTIGPPSAAVSAQPLGSISALAPVQGEQVSGAPTFQWTGVNGASSHTVYLWDRFPDLQSSTDPNGVVPIWTATVNQSGSGVVQKVYDGNALQSGTYYWMVVASDSGGNNLSATQIAKFRE